jgi:hypothetical protein
MPFLESLVEQIIQRHEQQSMASLLRNLGSHSMRLGDRLSITGDELISIVYEGEQWQGALRDVPQRQLALMRFGDTKETRQIAHDIEEQYRQFQLRTRIVEYFGNDVLNLNVDQVLAKIKIDGGDYTRSFEDALSTLNQQEQKKLKAQKLRENYRDASHINKHALPPRGQAHVFSDFLTIAPLHDAVLYGTAHNEHTAVLIPQLLNSDAAIAEVMRGVTGSTIAFR